MDKKKQAVREWKKAEGHNIVVDTREAHLLRDAVEKQLKDLDASDERFFEYQMMLDDIEDMLAEWECEA